MAHDFGRDSRHLGEIAKIFLKIGVMSYGGPAIMGIIQAETQERRSWLSKERFVEGLALVNMLPGPGATQLGIFVAHARGGIWAGIVAGLCFVLPAFLIMLSLSMAYAAWGAVPALRGALYGIGPVVLAVFAVAVQRLASAAIKDHWQVMLAVGAALAAAFTPFGLIAILIIAGTLGIALYHSRLGGLLAAAGLAGILALPYLIGSPIDLGPAGSLGDPRLPVSVVPLWQIGVFFLKIGAFTFGGGLSMLAFIEAQVVNELRWLSAQEFLDGLALGQLTPGPILMLAAFIGYKLSGVAGAAVAATAIFLPSFVMMLAILPMMDRIKKMGSIRAFMRGIGPSVIGTTAVSMAQMLPHAAPDGFTLVLLVIAIVAILFWRIGPLPLMIGGALAGLGSRAAPLARLRELVH